MTTPTTQATATRTVELPAPKFPMVTRVVSSALFPEDTPQGTRKEDPVTWVISHAHPLVPNVKVVRMFSDQWGVEIYSISDDGRNGMRNFVPRERVRLVEEAMPLDVFIEELAAAEADEDEPDEPEPPAIAVTNGQVAP
jgi:hypothetical protein